SLERAKRPLIDRSARTWILHRKVGAIYRRVDARRIGVEVGANTLEITERGAHQDVGATPGGHEEAREVLAIANHPLRRRRFVVHAARIDVRLVLHEIAGDLPR